MMRKDSISGPVSHPVFEKHFRVRYFLHSMAWEPMLINKCLEGGGTVVEEVPGNG
jgi:hypothetical protein